MPARVKSRRGCGLSGTRSPQKQGAFLVDHNPARVQRQPPTLPKKERHYPAQQYNPYRRRIGIRTSVDRNFTATADQKSRANNVDRKFLVERCPAPDSGYRFQANRHLGFTLVERGSRKLRQFDLGINE
jgi:hypothetical protein